MLEKPGSRKGGERIVPPKSTKGAMGASGGPDGGGLYSRLGLDRDNLYAIAGRTFLSLVALLIVWQLVAQFLIMNRLVLAPPTAVLRALVTDGINGDLLKNSYATLLEILVSFPVAVVIGVAIGVMLSASRTLGQIAEPLLTALYSVPMIALAPLFIASLGLGLASKFAIILAVSVFPIIITTEVGLSSTDRTFLDVASSFNATRLQVFTTVQFPFALPYIVSGLRVAFARALVGAVVGEFFGAFAGYGFAILAASQNFNTARLLGYVALLAILGMLGSITLRWVERRMTPWREET